MDIREMLCDVASHGGKHEVGEFFYHPYDDEAERLGLVKTDFEGGGWGHTITIELTNKGRRYIGLDVVTPPESVSFKRRILGALGKLIGAKAVR